MASLLTDLSTETVHEAVSARPQLDMAFPLLCEIMGASRLKPNLNLFWTSPGNIGCVPMPARPGFYPQGRHTPPPPAMQGGEDFPGKGCTLGVELSH